MSGTPPAANLTHLADARLAGKAGIKGTYRNEYGQAVFGDIIIEVDGEKVGDTSELYGAIDSKKARTAVQLRSGRKRAHNLV